ncbi:MAG: hypothetical protein ABFC63_00770 [Thermoguttaceae bacterium]
MKRYTWTLLILAGVLSLCDAAQADYPTTGMEAGPILSPAPPQPNPSGWPPSQTTPAGYSTYSSTGPAVPTPPPAEQPGFTATPSTVSTTPPPASSSSGTPTGSSLNSLICPRQSHWNVAVDALWLSRTSDRPTEFGWTDYNPYSGAPQAIYTDSLWSDDKVFSFAPGVRLQVAAQMSEWMSIEGIGWGLQQWSVGRTIYGDPDTYSVLAYSPWLQIPLLIGDGLDDYLSYRYKSEVANAELNQRFQFCPDDPFRSVSFLWGVRYVYLSDDLTLSGSDLYNSVYENLRWQTKNNLVGMQVGLQCARNWDRFQLSLEAKIGLYGNIYSQHGTDTGSATGFSPMDISHNGTDLAALFEASISARYRITDWLWARAGYQYYGISGLALGNRQLAGYDSGGWVGLDGLSVGLELTR